jgi:hypothetical protein
VKISGTVYVKVISITEEPKGGRNRLCTIKRGKAKWIGHILRRDCFLKLVVEGKIEGARR